MKSYQAKELEARIKLKSDLSDKGKLLIWGVNRTYQKGNKTIFDFRSQEYRPFTLSYSIDN